MKQVKLNANVDKMLNEIVALRKKNLELICTKQSIVAELIILQHKKEIGKKR